MKVIIAGGRELSEMHLVVDAVAASGFREKMTEVVSGCAPGIDTLALAWADDNDVPVARFPAEWERLGKQAGPLRNVAMAAYADALIAIPGRGPGTKHMIATAKRYGRLIYVHEMPPAR